jgi:hypothetical protein
MVLHVTGFNIFATNNMCFISCHLGVYGRIILEWITERKV